MDEGREETAIRSLLTENKKLKQRVFELEESTRKGSSAGESHQGGSSSVLKLIEHKDFQLEQLSARLEEKKEQLSDAERQVQRFGELLDRDATLLVVLDGEGRVAFVNRAAAQRFGEKLKMCLGQRFEESGLPAADPSLIARIRQVSASGKAEPAEVAGKLGTLEPIGAVAEKLGVLLRIRANPQK